MNQIASTSLSSNTQAPNPPVPNFHALQTAGAVAFSHPAARFGADDLKRCEMSEEVRSTEGEPSAGSSKDARPTEYRPAVDLHTKARSKQTHSGEGRSGETQKLLMITAIAGAENCAASLGVQLKMAVNVVGTRRESFAALRGQDYAAIIIDNAISDSDPQGAALLRKHAGSAVLLEVNFAISGVARLARQVRGEMDRRKQENILAMGLASTALASELKEMVAGLLLHSQLALVEPGISPQMSSKLQLVVQLAGNLRRRLDLPVPRA